MSNKKINCWEFLKCQEIPTEDYKTCKAFVDKTYNGINSGMNGGRYCWRIVGSFSGRPCCGFFSLKYKSDESWNCTKCEFYCKVRDEEFNFAL